MLFFLMLFCFCYMLFCFFSLFGEEAVAEFAVTVTDDWRRMSEARNGCTSNGSKLRVMVQHSTGICRKLLAAFMCLTPHSMGTERAVSHYNQIKSTHRLNTNTDTVLGRMLVSMNGVGVGGYDPRPAVAHFLRAKERRWGNPTPEVYAKQEFAKSFFRS